MSIPSRAELVPIPLFLLRTGGLVTGPGLQSRILDDLSDTPHRDWRKEFEPY